MCKNVLSLLTKIPLNSHYYQNVDIQQCLMRSWHTKINQDIMDHMYHLVTLPDSLFQIQLETVFVPKLAQRKRGMPQGSILGLILSWLSLLPQGYLIHKKHVFFQYCSADSHFYSPISQTDSREP